MEASWLAGTLINPYTLIVLLTIFSFVVFTYSGLGARQIAGLLKNRSKRSAVVLSKVIVFLLSVVCAFILAFPVMMAITVLAIIVGFLVFNCSFGPLWAGIGPAHQMHATLKYVRTTGGETPRTMEEFKQINPQAFKDMEDHAQVTYEYLKDTNGYHFTVRPSKYVFADFSDKNDYVLYRTESVVSPGFFRQSPLLE